MRTAAVVTATVAAISLFDAACADSRASELAPAKTPAGMSAADTGSIRELVDGIRGANAVQCELIVQSFTGWTSNVPDRDAHAWSVAQRRSQKVVDPGDIAWLGEQMRAGSGCAARAAARLLARSPTPAARAILVSALSDQRADVRRLAAVGIGFRSDSTMNTRLVGLLRDGDAGVRAAAAWALGAVH